ncbi:bile acid:sodium symporter family protein [Sporomusa sphaeroides]|uniref:Sodium Bile acid symporter family protein n=1 Tax=Sporomusa sphaeroides DSM 2875 TaxID=1337886 RepID=A0ABM9W847_9FIRM|nr:bile acid:sodium symporter family protein [Sporomusa sphaeroides]OLS54921.1 sodium bile acid symporter family protein [Sporomusa sphaeroides DSM 2875]CVK21212.1 Sodium Bile acid symporter family protein [Sporomusa sphaeroides DSM 2875]
MNTFEKIVKFITKLFPLWVVIFAGIAFFSPEPFKPFGKFIPYLLGLIMLGMGLTMSLDDFRLVFTRPKDVLYGVFLRCLIMPGVAFGVAKLLDLPPALAAGLILVGACPSGTASNVMTFIAKGDTALSVTVSSINTILAPILTPYIFLFLAGSLIPIDAKALLLDILIIVLFPVTLGILIRGFASDFVDRIAKVIPLVSVLSIIAIISIVVALSAAKLAVVAGIAFVAVALHNALGLGLGYGASRAVGINHKKSKAICFEIGMENSGLAVALAVAHLDPIAAIPGAIFSVWHNFTGSLLAGYWGAKDEDEPEVPTGVKA